MANWLVEKFSYDGMTNFHPRSYLLSHIVLFCFFFWLFLSIDWLIFQKHNTRWHFPFLVGHLIIVSFRLPVSGCPRSYFRVGDLNFAWIVSSGIFLYHCRTKEDAISLSSFSGGQHRLESAGKLTAILRDLFQLLWVEMNVIKARDNLRCRQEVACQIPGDRPVCP